MSKPPSPDKTGKKDPRTRGYPRKRKPIPEDQLERDRKNARKLYSVLYALPFLVLIVVILLFR